MKPKPRKASWRHRRLTRREEVASVWMLFVVPALMVALLAPLSWCSPPGAAGETTGPAASIGEAREHAQGVLGTSRPEPRWRGFRVATDHTG